MPARFFRDHGHGSRSAKRVQHDVAPVTVEFDEAIDEFLREGGGVGFVSCFRSFALRLWRIQAGQERLPSSRFGLNLPKAVRVIDELIAGDIGLCSIALQLPVSLRKHQHVLPTRNNVGIARAFPRTPRGTAAHRLFVPQDLRAHDEPERTQLRGHVVVDGLEVLDAGRRNVQREAAAVHEDAVKFAPHRQQPRQIFVVGHAVVMAVIFQPHVVRRRGDRQMHASLRQPAQNGAEVAANDAILPAGFLHAPLIAQCLARRKRNLL